MPGPTRTLGARVVLDGEAEYKRALSELNSGSATLRSEMTKLQAEFRGQGESTEYLTERGKLLEQQLLQQQDKVAMLREAVASMAAEYGESNTKTQEWIRKLNNAEAEEYNLKNAIAENNEALENQGNVMNKLADGVTGLAERFGIQLPGGAEKALDAMRGFSNGSVAALGLASAAVAALIEGMKALNEISIQYAAEADELITNSAISGLSTTLLQELQYAEPLIDVSVDTITQSLTKLTRSMADAEGGNDTLKAKFEALGVSITGADGQLRSAQEVFFDTVDALGQMGNDTERDAVAMALLGKSAQDLNPLIKQGTGALKEYIEAADENYVLTEEQIAALGGLDDAVQKNELRWDSLKRQIAAQFAPASTAALESFGRLVEAAGNALIDSKIIEGVGEILEVLSNMLTPLTNLLDTADGTPDRLHPVYEILHQIAGALALIQDTATIVGTLINPLQWGKGNITTALGWNINDGQMSNYQQWKYGNSGGNYYDPGLGGYTGNYGRNAGGTDNWRGGLTWVGEAGPELVALPSGAQVYNTQDSRSLGGDVYNITIDAASVREFEDIVKIAQSARVRRRMR